MYVIISQCLDSATGLERTNGPTGQVTNLLQTGCVERDDRVHVHGGWVRVSHLQVLVYINEVTLGCVIDAVLIQSILAKEKDATTRLRILVTPSSPLSVDVQGTNGERDVRRHSAFGII